MGLDIGSISVKSLTRPIESLSVDCNATISVSIYNNASSYSTKLGNEEMISISRTS
jgi:hypothetical protein